jgi:hypothetical protein
VSNPGYGNQNGPYQPGSPYPTDPQAPQPSVPDPWGQPAAGPYPVTPGSGGEYAAPVSGAQYSVPNYGVPPEAAPPTSVPPGSVPPTSVPPGPASAPPGGVPVASAPPAGYTPGYAPGYATGPIPTVTGYPTAPLPGGTEVGPSAYGHSPGRRNRLVPILGAATVLLLVVGLTMTGLFVAKNGEQNDTQAKLAAAESTIKERGSKVSTRYGELRQAGHRPVPEARDRCAGRDRQG